VDAAVNGMTLSNGGLTATSSVQGYKSIRGTVSRSSGKYYVEFLIVLQGGNAQSMNGVASASFDPTGGLGSSIYSAGAGYTTVASTGFTKNYGLGTYGSTGTVVGMAVDFTAGSVYFAFNNVWFNGGNPATGSLPSFSFVPATVGALFPALSNFNPNEVWTLQPTAASQKYAPPAGFSPWN
jgi:hypothetical protein